MAFDIEGKTYVFFFFFCKKDISGKAGRSLELEKSISLCSRDSKMLKGRVKDQFWFHAKFDNIY